MLEAMRRLPTYAFTFAVLAAGLLAGSSPAVTGPSGTAPAAVVELFTSQGCSSCPPADALLGRLSKQPGIIALSFAIDYWDYLGWRDTLGSAANSERQRDYARTRGDGRVYTPQVVVDGVMHVNGADEAAILRAIKGADKRLADVRVPVRMEAKGDVLVIDVGAAPPGSDKREAAIWLAVAGEVAKVSIKRGENRGRDLSYHHPVRELMPVGMWTGEPMTIRLPLNDLKTMGGDCLAALLQEGRTGPILGAAVYEQNQAD